jgi:excisionase family DNA binding protein
MTATSTGLEKRRPGVLGPRWDDREVFTLEETAQILRLPRPATYAAVKSGQIPTIKFGTRRIVPRWGIERLLTGEAAADA